MHECAFQQRNLDFRCEICVICSNEYLPWVELGSFRCMDIRPFGLKLGKYGEWGRILLFSTFLFFAHLIIWPLACSLEQNLQFAFPFCLIHVGLMVLWSKF